jgi:hypothetical protein
MVNKVDICHHCGQEKENCYYGYIAMCIPIPEFEAKKIKYGGGEWWKNLERTDLTEEEFKELDALNMYDQLLNTVGRGVQCDDCGKNEEELYNQYYPDELKL